MSRESTSMGAGPVHYIKDPADMAIERYPDGSYSTKVRNKKTICGLEVYWGEIREEYVTCTLCQCALLDREIMRFATGYYSNAETLL
jgi:hypothetical protein